MAEESRKPYRLFFPNPVGQGTVARYSAAVVSILIAFAIRLLLDPLLGDSLPLLTLYGGVALAVWFGGWLPACLAALIGFVLANYSFIEARHQFAFDRVEVWVGLLGYSFSCGIIIYLGEEMRRAKDRAQQHSEQADHDLIAMKYLHEVGAQCARANDGFEVCLDAMVQAAIAITKADKGNLQLFDPSSGRLTIAAQYGFDEPFLKFFNEVNNEDAAACSAAVARAERVIVENVEHSKLFAGAKSLEVLLNAGVHAVQSTPLLSSRGTVVGIISTHFSKPHRTDERELNLMDLLARQSADYLERKRADEALRSKEAELETIINQTPFMLTRCTRDLRYKFASRAYAEMLGRDPQEIAGKSIIEVMGHAGCKAIMPYVERVLGGEQVEYESEVPFQGVGVKSLRVVYTPDRDERGEVTGWVASITDIEDRKRADAAREERLKAEHALRNVAEETNRLKDEFLAIMSHELRNPLNVIVGYSELLVRNHEIAQLPEVLGMAEAIKRNALIQSRLIRDLLDLSRLRSGKLQLNLETVSMVVTVANAIDTIRSEATAKQILIDIVSSHGALFVEGDSVRLEQIVWNLLNNSVKFTPEGGKITVRLDKQGDQVILRVEDTGQGIDPSFLPHVFELFRQADASTRRSQSGMGIGLAVVQQLIELHKGSINASSGGRGKGAVFTVQLPLSVKTEAPTRPITSLATLEKFTVLVVDDSADTTEMLEHLLKLSGANVTPATSGDEALRIVAQREFDVVLSDISMPGMDGFEFLRQLRQLPGREDLPVLALTGFGRPEDVERARTEGFFSHLTKPFDVAALLEILQRVPRKT